MNHDMAHLILQKKLRQLEDKLATKKVRLTLSPEAFEHLLAQGFTTEYGAREMDRVISQQLKPLLMKEILFGTLKHGGDITIILKDAHLSIG
jgi:ATP-dependent Clp protease ATP-binding subunit ClpA